MLKNERDPKKRAEAINSIVQSISVVPNQILRDTYIHDCAQRIGLNESTLINQMNNFIRGRKTGSTAPQQDGVPVGPQPQPAAAPTAMDSTTPMQQASKVEMMLAQLIIRHGERVIMNDVEDEEGNHYSLTVAQYIYYNLAADNLSLHNDLFNKILHEACEHSTEPGFKAEPYFINHEDINMSKLATDMSMDRYHLSQRKADGPTTRRRNCRPNATKRRACATKPSTCCSTSAWTMWRRNSRRFRPRCARWPTTWSSSRRSWSSFATCRCYATSWPDSWEATSWFNLCAHTLLKER